jgi:hypothetical protein
MPHDTQWLQDYAMYARMMAFTFRLGKARPARQPRGQEGGVSFPANREREAYDTESNPIAQT